MFSYELVSNGEYHRVEMLAIKKKFTLRVDGGIAKTSSSCQPDWICPGLSLSRISPLDGAELSGEVLQMAGSDATYFSGTLLGSHPMA